MVTVAAPPHKEAYTGQGRIYTGQARHLLANWGFVFTKVLFFITIYIIRTHIGQPHLARFSSIIAISLINRVEALPLWRGRCLFA